MTLLTICLRAQCVYVTWRANHDVVNGLFARTMRIRDMESQS